MKGLYAIVLVACGGNAPTISDAPPPAWSVTCEVTGGPPRADAHPTFELGESTINGDLERARIIDVLDAAAGLAACPAPSSATSLEVDWFIEPHGTVANVTAPTDALGRCVSGVVTGLRFPAPRGGGGVMIHYRFDFHPPRTQSFATRGRIERASVQAAIEARLPAIADCFAHAPDSLSIDVGGSGTHVGVGADYATGCVTRQLAAMRPTTMPIACAVTHG